MSCCGSRATCRSHAGIWSVVRRARGLRARNKGTRTIRAQLRGLLPLRLTRRSAASRSWRGTLTFTMRAAASPAAGICHRLRHYDCCMALGELWRRSTRCARSARSTTFTIRSARSWTDSLQDGRRATLVCAGLCRHQAHASAPDRRRTRSWSTAMLPGAGQVSAQHLAKGDHAGRPCRLFPLICDVVAHAPADTGMRHFLFIAPPIAVLAGCGTRRDAVPASMHSVRSPRRPDWRSSFFA